jgi:hypothetical protein
LCLVRRGPPGNLLGFRARRGVGRQGF